MLKVLFAGAALVSGVSACYFLIRAYGEIGDSRPSNVARVILIDMFFRMRATDEEEFSEDGLRYRKLSVLMFILTMLLVSAFAIAKIETDY